MASTKKTVSHNRIVYLDILRVIACFAVVMIHASASFVTKNAGSPDFWVGNILDSVSRIGVPLFIMISGALMLDENYAYSAPKIRKHIIKLAAAFVFWSVIYCLFNHVIPSIRHGEGLDFRAVSDSLLQGPYHFWYIFVIAGLYLLVPLLRLWVKKENKRYVQYFLVLAMIFTFILPQITEIGKHFSDVFFLTIDTLANKLSLKYVAGYTAYYLLGWYIRQFEIRRKKLLYGLGILSLLLTVLGTFLLQKSTGKATLMYNNLHITVLLQATAVFLLMKTKFVNTETENGVVRQIAAHSFGIYLVHILILETITAILYYFGVESAFLQIPIVFVCTVVFSFVAAALLSKIPFLKKFV